MGLPGRPLVRPARPLPSIRLRGGPPPAGVFAVHPVAADADPDAVTSVVAALAGFFVWHGMQPPPPGLPMVRAFQRAQGDVALDWLRRRMESSPCDDYRRRGIPA